MAKAKDKEVAASDVPSNVEETTGIDGNAESDPLESVDMEEETTMVVDEPEEEDKKEETEDNGKVESVGTDVPEDEKMDEEYKAEEVKATEDIEADGKAEKPTEDINADGKVEKPTEDINADGKVEKPTEGINADGKGESASNKKAKMIGKRRRKKKATVKGATSSEKTNQAATGKKEAAAEKKEAVAEKEVSKEKPNEKLTDTDRPEASAAEKKNKKMVDGMGLIFMCNAKTKKDCFNYKVLGLPASKKDLVEKVYKGMRLFLFDIDLKLMYGIYKAASPGGYNLEPKAFKSAFPSQVRFTVLKDCLPLPEEKFKAAIKGNYYGRNKFNCQLSAEQVRNLCKLFRSAGKASFSKQKSREAIRAETGPTTSDQEHRRPRIEKAKEDHRGREMDRRERAREDRRGRERQDRRERSREDRRGRERQDRRERVREDRVTPRIRGHDLYSRRETYASPPPRAVALPPPLPPPSYAYERLVDDYYYRMDPLPSLELRRDPLSSIELRDPRVMDVDIRPREPVEYREPYALFREPLQYREAGYPPSSLLPAAYAPLYPRY